MHILDDKEASFLVKFALSKLSPGILQDLRGSTEKRERALEIATKRVLDQFRLARHQIVGPAWHDPHGNLPEREKRSGQSRQPLVGDTPAAELPPSRE